MTHSPSVRKRLLIMVWWWASPLTTGKFKTPGGKNGESLDISG